MSAAAAASHSIDITYVPADCGSLIPGKSKAPQAFRDIGIVTKLQEAGIPTVSEHHALDAPARYSSVAFETGSVRNEELNVAVCRRVKEAIARNLDAGSVAANQAPSFQLVLGGECCMLPAVMSAFWHHYHNTSATTRSNQPKRIGLIYIDADTDLASPTDPKSSGNLAGMNMTHLLRTPGALESMVPFTRPSPLSASDSDAALPVCDATNTVLFGINTSFSGNTRSHFTYLFDNDFKLISSSAVARDPVQQAKIALKHLIEEHNVDVIVVHLDVDAIDPSMFPLANLPNFTGVSFERMMEALEVFLGDERVAGLVVAEVNPDHDPGLGMIGRLVGELVRMFAARRLER